jgi:hypothetical protein
LEDGQALKTAWMRMEPFLARLAAKPETQAVVALSSATEATNRLPFDTHSDFDVGLVLDVPVTAGEWRAQPWVTSQLVRDRLPGWLPNFSFHVPVPWGRLEVNVNQLIYDYEADERTEWEDAKCEAYAETGQIFFDRDGRFARLVRRKAAERLAGGPGRMLRMANRLEWDIGVLPRRQADRGELATAHYMVGRALDELIEACFTLAGRFVPNQKWHLFILRERELLSEADIDRLEHALHCDPTSRSDLERRIGELSQVWASLRMRSSGVPDDPYRTFAASQAQLASATFADAVRERFGTDAYDAANYLLADTPEALAAAAGNDEVPPEWRQAIAQLAAA